LDIGCADGAIFHQLGRKIREGVGIDPNIPESKDFGSYRLLRGKFPDALQNPEPFDVITLLAVLEHIPPAEQKELAENVVRYLKPGGRLIITVPSPRIDQMLDRLKSLRLIDGMSLEEHYGFDIRLVPSIFSVNGLELAGKYTFQFGLNHLFVFRRAPSGNSGIGQPRKP
jgi:SAM-dependent methyltransferase